MKFSFDKTIFMSQIKGIWDKTKKPMLVLALVITSFYAGTMVPNKDTYDAGLKITIIQKKVEVFVGTSDQRIIDSAPYAVSATLNGKNISSNKLVATTNVTNIAKEEGTKNVSFMFSYTENNITYKAPATLTIEVSGEEPTQPEPINPDDISNKGNATYKANALATPIKKGQMRVLGTDEIIYVPTEGFKTPSLNDDVKNSTVENKNSSVALADKKMDTAVANKEFGNDKTSEDVKKVVNDAKKVENNEIKVSDSKNKAVKGATSKEVETEVVNGEVKSVVVKPTAKAYIIKMLDGKVLNLTSNLSGNVDGATARLIQNADGTFTDTATHSFVSLDLGTPMTKIIEGYSFAVTVYNTNAGLLYVS